MANTAAGVSWSTWFHKSHLRTQNEGHKMATAETIRQRLQHVNLTYLQITSKLKAAAKLTQNPSCGFLGKRGRLKTDKHPQSWIIELNWIIFAKEETESQRICLSVPLSKISCLVKWVEVRLTEHVMSTQSSREKQDRNAGKHTQPLGGQNSRRVTETHVRSGEFLDFTWMWED